MGAPDRADPLVERIVHRGLGGHRRGLGHAVTDGHLGHVHHVDALAHHLDRARRTGHDPGAQGRQVVVGEVGQGQLGDEHGRDAVQRRAAFLLDRAQGRARVEDRGRDDDRRTVRGAGQIAQHHPEAVVERHGDADPIGFGVAATLTDEVAVVEDVVVRERRALGEAGRAGRVLDVDRVIETQARVACGQVVLVAGGLGQQGRPVVGTQIHDAFQVRGLGPHRIHHVPVARTAVLGHGDQQPAAGLPQRVLQFVRAVRRVEVHQDHAGPRSGVLQHHPFGPVRRPDAKAIAHGQAGTDQGRRGLVHGGIELGVGVSDVLGQVDHARPRSGTERRCGAGSHRSSRPTAEGWTARSRRTASVRRSCPDVNPRV